MSTNLTLGSEWKARQTWNCASILSITFSFDAPKPGMCYNLLNTGCQRTHDEEQFVMACFHECSYILGNISNAVCRCRPLIKIRLKPSITTFRLSSVASRHLTAALSDWTSPGKERSLFQGFEHISACAWTQIVLYNWTCNGHVEVIRSFLPALYRWRPSWSCNGSVQKPGWRHQTRHFRTEWDGLTEFSHSQRYLRALQK